MRMNFWDKKIHSSVVRDFRDSPQSFGEVSGFTPDLLAILPTRWVFQTQRVDGFHLTRDGNLAKGTEPGCVMVEFASNSRCEI